MADERSYDDTEPTPEPNIFRPPLPSQYPGDEARSPNTSLLEESLFSFSAGGTLDDDEDGEQSSLPSFPQVPPSPLSRPSLSLLDEGTSRPHSVASASQGTRSRQPPISEVHVQEDDDTFFECVEDRSLARRTRRSLLASPKAKASRQSPSAAASTQSPSSAASTHSNASVDLSLSAAASTQFNTSVDLSLSQIHPTTLAAAAVQKSPIARSSPQNVSQTRSVDVSSGNGVRVHGNALQALVQMKEKLIKAHEANHALEQEKRTLAQDRDEVKRKLHDYQVEQQEELEGLSKEREEWFHEKNELELQLRTAARGKKDSMHRKLAADNRQKQWKSQLDDTNVELEEALAQKEVLASDLARVQKHNEALQDENEGLTQQLESQVAADSKKIRELRLETEEKDNAVIELKAALDARKEEAERLRNKLLKYKEALKEANDAMKSKPAHKSPSSRSARSSTSTNVRFQEDDHGVLETSIADRLAKMRDSAERAHMIRVHKRDVSRLKVDKESELQNLVAEHEEVMRKASKETTSTLNAKLEEVKTTLKEEYDEKAAELEKRHSQKFVEMQKEYLRSQEDADEALQSALVKVTEASQEYEKEAARRASTQRALESLKSQSDNDKQKLQERYEGELEKYRLQWEEERETLLSVIQDDCNSAFESRRRNYGGTRPTTSTSQRLSPTSTLGSSFPPTLTVNTGRQDRHSSALLSPSESAQLISPGHSDIESVLKETEDLIQSIF